ncbi:septation protein SepH [Virgisporangium aurantiacum]|uniref:DUF3071 domain-containing protein n=1 Tax=Virgisporangium aurantiacum TaxID=175570 RepID=A0A8J3Z9M6_9ACTN|nr:septation protein SepH [Virgisporangium aurantiacum]GIJ59941.1 hypothetical protein Vau01_074570 [Virgisporangium aurantiacum]
MRPVRFVALSEDGQAFVLADEVGRLLALPIDDRVSTALRLERTPGSGPAPAPTSETGASSLSPRDIQARIRAGESADEVARVAGVPVDRVLRYAGPVLQERAMLAQHARRSKLRSSPKGASLAEVVDSRLGQHGIDAEKISWDAYRRDDGTWRVIARWPSGKATAQAVWELDKARQHVTPHDDMAQYLCAERPAPGSVEAAPAVPGRGDPRYEAMRSGHDVMRPAADTARRDRPGRGLGPAEPAALTRPDQHRSDQHRPDPLRPDRLRPDTRRPDPLRPDSGRPDSGRPDRLRPDPLRPDSGRSDSRPDRLRPEGRPESGAEPSTSDGTAAQNQPAALDKGRATRPDPIRSGRDALLASLERPLGAPREVAAAEQVANQEPPRRARGAAALIGAPVPTSSPFEDDPDGPVDSPSVPSLAVLRPRLKSQPEGPARGGDDKPRKRLPSWDDVLFGGAPARESS